jgi:ribonuclease-3
MSNIQNLLQKIGYAFKNSHLLNDALSHRSFHGKNNERLEFLGDSILNFVISSAIYRKCPNAREGELSRLRATLVCGEMLASLAQEFELGNYLRLGQGELKSGGAHRTSILADAMEAIVGAIYLDGGLPACEERILSWYENRLKDLSDLPDLRDPKTRLQEYLQSRQLPLPHYEIQKIEGSAHEQIFFVKCHIENFGESSIGQGTNRRKAEQDAALKILETLEKRT